MLSLYVFLSLSLSVSVSVSVSVSPSRKKKGRFEAEASAFKLVSRGLNIRVLLEVVEIFFSSSGREVQAKALMWICLMLIAV